MISLTVKWVMIKIKNRKNVFAYILVEDYSTNNVQNELIKITSQWVIEQTGKVVWTY